MDTITLKTVCHDKKGLIAAITGFIFKMGGNIVNLDQHTDARHAQFFMRLEWDEQGFTILPRDLRFRLRELYRQEGIDGKLEIFFSSKLPRMAVFVSKYDHCLYDLLIKHKSGELKCEIPLVISNHDDLNEVAASFGVDFFHVPVTRDNRVQAETKQLELLANYRIDFIVLARYMQILSQRMISPYTDKIINIHHSFLPAFQGAKPYHQAFERGVKIIGATSHFVTSELDTGPIIQQDIIQVSHKESIDDFIIKGRDIEKLVLARAIRYFIQNRVFVYRNKTIIL